MNAIEISLCAGAAALLIAVIVLAVRLVRRGVALQLANRDLEAARAEIAGKEAGFEAEKKRMSEQAERERERLTAQFARDLEAMKTAFSDISQKHLREQEKEMRAANAVSLKPMLDAIDATMKDFGAAFRDNRDQQLQNKASFDQAIRDLGEKALSIGKEAETLTKALRNDSKVQGNWGEAILANVLSGAGLEQGRDFLVQQHESDEKGGTLIPDVEIPLPDGDKLIVDSKASLTAYCDYVGTEDETARAAAVKAHLQSVRKHVDELAEKDYGRNVKKAQGYVLMFIPNDGAYLLAMQNDDKLAVDAFRRRVIIVNPATLMLCLQMVQMLRSREKQSENCEKIFELAAKMYDKFATFAQTFTKLGSGLESLRKTYDEANSQLCAGHGNFSKQLESLKDCGVITAKSLPEKMIQE